MEAAQHRLVTLWEKRAAQTLTTAEETELLHLLQQADAEQTLSPVLYKGWKAILSQDIGTGLSGAQIDQLMERLPVADEAHQGAVVNGRFRILRHWWAAAAVLLLLGAGWWWTTRTPGQPPIVPVAVQQPDILPGQDGAILTLADGSQVLLDSVRNGIVARQGNAAVRVVDGVLYYDGTASADLYNTMRTPRGRKYHITLPDGTLVWLNAASSIRYPTRFAGDVRKVEVTGEVYLEVAKQMNATEGGSVPFLVSINNKATVEVLGTHFNINAYDEEANIAATLLEGKINVVSNSGQALLQPGQQAQIAQQGSGPITVVKAADLEQVIAWKNDLFNFEGATLQEAMRQLERWYDISVEYENGVPNVKLRGEMTQGVKLNDLLEALEHLGLHYKLEGRQLRILQ